MKTTDREVIYFDYSTFDNLINNAVEACRRLNQKGDFEPISDPISLGKVLENPEEYINERFDNDAEAVTKLEKHFGCSSIAELTPEERESKLFERTLGQKYKYYSFAVNEITRGRNELFTTAVWLLEYSDAKEWHYDSDRIRERCTFYELDKRHIQAIRELKRVFEYRNSPDAPQWFKNLFKQLDNYSYNDGLGALINKHGLAQSLRNSIEYAKFEEEQK